MELIKRLFKRLMGHRPPKKASAKVLDIVCRAWLDNPRAHVGGSAAGFARLAFHERVGAWVKRYYIKNGFYPTGWHKVNGVQMYFAPEAHDFELRLG